MDQVQYSCYNYDSEVTQSLQSHSVFYYSKGKNNNFPAFLIWFPLISKSLVLIHNSNFQELRQITLYFLIMLQQTLELTGTRNCLHYGLGHYYKNKLALFCLLVLIWSQLNNQSALSWVFTHTAAAHVACYMTCSM